jgi:hypothetical protein
MLTRRGFWLWLAALPVVAHARALRAITGEIWSGETIEKAEKGSIIVAGKHVRLHNRAGPVEMTILSTSNDNATYSVWLVLPLQRKTDYQYIKVGTAWWSSNGTGYDQQHTSTTVQVDRASAEKIAAAFALTIHDRTKLDGDLRYTWKFPPKVATTSHDPIAAVVRIENTGTVPVGISVGGRQRGARDNRFVFAIARNGKPLAIKDAPDFGGIMSYRPIEPGKFLDVTCPDVRAWADFSLPGYYTIDARYEAELAKDGKMPDSAAARANLWDITATGQGSILVQ